MTPTPTQSVDDAPGITFKPGSAADSYAVFLVFERAYADLTGRLGISEPTSIADPEALARTWAARRSLYLHLAATADQFWLARRGETTLGFARSIMRDGLRLLTELFIIPGEQSAGIGRELLARAFPTTGARRRWLLATMDRSAQALYLKDGLYPIFPVYYFRRQPRALSSPESDLRIRPGPSSAEMIQALSDIDARLLGHRRDVDHRWLMSERLLYLYKRAGQLVGYGYMGRSNGPFALLDDSDFPSVLAHAESEVARLGQTHFGLEVPMVNHQAVNYLMSAGYHIDAFMAQFMSDGPGGRFSNYIMTSPPFIL